MLLVFGGLPASGKSTVSRGVAQALRATHLRIDVIEQGLRDIGVRVVRDEGYELAYRIAAHNLSLGLTVVADSVNPIALTRDAWLEVGVSAGVPVLEIETICSDSAEHRHRVETRTVGIAGLRLPTWDEVVDREYEPWTRADLVIDTAGETPAASLDRTLAAIRERMA